MMIQRRKSAQPSWLRNDSQDKKTAQQRIKYNLFGIAILMIMYAIYWLKHL